MIRIIYHKILAYLIGHSRIYIEVKNDYLLLGDWTDKCSAVAVYTKDGGGSRIIIYAGFNEDKD